MARKKSSKLKNIKVKISMLQDEYRKKVSIAIKLKGKEFDDQIREANIVLDKIHTIRKKCELKDRYGKEHGVPDDLGLKINLE